MRFASAFATNQVARASDFDNDGQDHRPPAKAAVDELGEVVVERLLEASVSRMSCLAAFASDSLTTARSLCVSHGIKRWPSC